MKTNLVRARGGNPGKDILSKGSEVGGCLACSRNTQEVGAAVTQGVREHETWSESGSPRLAHIEPYDNSGFFLGIVGGAHCRDWSWGCKVSVLRASWLGETAKY